MPPDLRLDTDSLDTLAASVQSALTTLDNDFDIAREIGASLGSSVLESALEKFSKEWNINRSAACDRLSWLHKSLTTIDSSFESLDQSLTSAVDGSGASTGANGA